MNLAIASRIGGILSTPSNFLLLLLIVGVVLQCLHRYRNWGKGLVGAVTGTLVLIFFLPIGDWLMVPLGNQFQRPPALPHVDGIFLLGGGENVSGYLVHGLSTFNPAEGQLVAAAQLARQHPNARVIFSGGNQPLNGARISEATVARAVFQQMGLPASRLTLENQSRNTWENFINSRKRARPQPGETWLLVTSPLKMRRSIGIAARLHWHLLPWPQDYLTAGKSDGLDWNVSLAARLSRLEAALHEWIGLAAYRALGRLGNTG